MQTNMRRVELDGVLVDVPVELYARAHAEAELRVFRRLVESAAAEMEPESAAHVLATLDVEENRMRARLRLPPRRPDAV